MIDKKDLIAKLGKKGFTDFVTQHKSNQPTGHDRQRGIKGRIRWSRCQHGTWVIDNYEPKSCERCTGEWTKHSKPRDFSPYFNIGLGAYVESRSEEKKLAKSKGYVEAG